MCHVCQSTWDRHFRRLDARTQDFILWNLTPFPMGGDELPRLFNELAAKIKPQKRGWQRRLRRIAREADAEMERAMNEIREKV